MHSYETLVQDYADAIAIQQRAINAVRKRLIVAQRGFDFKEIQKRNAQLRILYDEKAELQERAAELQNYVKHLQQNKETAPAAPPYNNRHASEHLHS